VKKQVLNVSLQFFVFAVVWLGIDILFNQVIRGEELRLIRSAIPALAGAIIFVIVYAIYDRRKTNKTNS